LNFRLKKILQTIVFLSTGIIILYLVYYKQNQAYQAECALQGIAAEDCSLINKVYEDFLKSDFRILLLVLMLYFLSNISRALRWNMLLKTFGVRPRFINSFMSIMLGYFANLGLPRVGELIRAATLARYEKIKVDKVMGTVIIDRAMDVILILIVIAMALAGASTKLIAFLKENSDLSGKISALMSHPLVWVAGTTLLLVTLFLLRSKKVRASVFGQKIYNFIKGMIDGLKSIAELDKPWLFIFHSVFIWVMYYLMLYIGFSAFAPTAHLGLMAGLVVFTMGSIGFVIPSPGGMGTYHFLVIAALLMYGVNGADGFSFANIMFFTINVFANILFGLLALIILPAINTTYKQSLDD